jgi:hypothetical protein
MQNLVYLVNNKEYYEEYVDKYTKARCIRTDRILSVFNAIAHFEDCNKVQFELTHINQTKFIRDCMYIPEISAVKLIMIIDALSEHYPKYTLTELQIGDGLSLSIRPVFSDVKYKTPISYEEEQRVTYTQYQIFDKKQVRKLWKYLLTKGEIQYSSKKLGIVIVQFGNGFIIKNDNTIMTTTSMEGLIGRYLDHHTIEYAFNAKVCYA